ncbi:MAG: hypothetical protein HQM08_07360 [Candidatus Riflebacteria bacterium]|nr:hypothetical protein [Candidatus Riflebacteria bacterium]
MKEKRKYSFFCAHHGVTLIEIMMATLVMAFAIIPIASLLGVGAKMTSKDYRLIEATQILEKTGNSLFLQPFKEIPVGNYQYYATPPVILGDIPGKFATYTVYMTCEMNSVSFNANMINVQGAAFQENAPKITDFDTTPKTFVFDNMVKKIMVEVRWIEPNGPQKSLFLVTYRADLS